MAIPHVVSADEWRQAREELLIAEKEATRAQDALAARRRRLPMVAFGAYTFTATSGNVTLRDLFGDMDQLMVYQFMDLGPDGVCPGCMHLTSPCTDGRRTGRTHPTGGRSARPTADGRRGRSRGCRRPVAPRATPQAALTTQLG